MVILLVTGPMCAGKEIFANILKERYNYKILKVKTCNILKLWDFEKNKPCEEEEKDDGKLTRQKQEIIEETNELIKIALKDWKENYVIYPIYIPKSIEKITKKRSYFRIVGINSSIKTRFDRFNSKSNEIQSSFEDFVRMDDYLNFEVGISECLAKAEFQISNIGSIEDFNKKIESNIFSSLRSKVINRACLNHMENFQGITRYLRPSWDIYFMKLAHVVRERSNCMKRSVGAIIVQNNRIVSTGYNGTPGKLKNCYQGGCERCNLNMHQGQDLDKCNCIHAEENAVLECGVHRAKDATIYTTLAPCRWCAKILIQADVKRVVYDENYSMHGDDTAVTKLFEIAGIKFECVTIDL